MPWNRFSFGDPATPHDNNTSYNFDTFVNSPQSRHSRESGNPELVENTGFRVKPGMTDKVNFDFL
jgi:hypothetical protein